METRTGNIRSVPITEARAAFQRSGLSSWPRDGILEPWIVSGFQDFTDSRCCALQELRTGRVAELVLLDRKAR